jgi:hypothetical protein
MVFNRFLLLTLCPFNWAPYIFDIQDLAKFALVFLKDMLLLHEFSCHEFNHRRNQWSHILKMFSFGQWNVHQSVPKKKEVFFIIVHQWHHLLCSESLANCYFSCITKLFDLEKNTVSGWSPIIYIYMPHNQCCNRNTSGRIHVPVIYMHCPQLRHLTDSRGAILQYFTGSVVLQIR